MISLFKKKQIHEILVRTPLRIHQMHKEIELELIHRSINIYSGSFLMFEEENS